MADPCMDLEIASISLGKILYQKDTSVFKDMEAFTDEEFVFLSIFHGYSQVWCDDAHEVDKILAAKVAATTKAIREELQKCAFLVCFPSKWREVLPCLWRKTRHLIATRQSRDSTLLRSFAKLKEKIELLKQEINDVYPRANLFGYSFQIQPASSLREKFSDWENFCFSVVRKLQSLSEKTDFTAPLRSKLLKLGWNLQSLTTFLSKTHFVHSHPVMEDVMAHHGAIVIRAAHLCCFCWAVKMDENMERDVSVLVSDLVSKIDLAATSPEFVEMLLGFLEKCYLQLHKGRSNYASDIGQVKKSFVQDLLHLEEVPVICAELLSLLTCVTQIPKVHNKDIAAVIREAAAIKFNDSSTFNKKAWKSLARPELSSVTCNKFDLVVLFARIWYLKAKIFLEGKASGTTLDLYELSTGYQIVAVHKGSQHLQRYFGSPKEAIENLIFAHLDQLPRQVESLYKSSFHVKEFQGNKVIDVLYKFLVLAMLSKAKEILWELLNERESLTATIKCQIGKLHEGLIFVTASDIINQPKEEIREDEKQILTESEDVAVGVISLCNSSFGDDKITVEAVKNTNLRLCELLDMVQNLKANLKKIYLQVPRLNFPTIYGLGFIQCLIQSLRGLLNRKPDSIAFVTHQIEAILWDLESLITSLGGIEIQGQHNLYITLNDAAYLAEYVVDKIVIGSSGEWHHLLWLYHASEEIRCIKAQILNSYEKQNHDDKIHNVPMTSSRLTSQASSPSNIHEVIVNLKDQEDEIIDRLTRGTSERDIVSIVGMPGIGKTTLANKVFHDPRVIYHFHIRAWCCVSQVYRKRDLLIDILSHIIRFSDQNILSETDEDLELVLHKNLKGNRYLIVVDDLWNSGAWEDLQRSIPNDGNQSRILITSRLHDVALKVKPESSPHQLRLLSGDESWKLLEKKIFRGERCPEELIEVGKQISENCKGLPLAVVAIAGVLERISNNFKQNRWKEIAESLSSQIVNDPQMRCMDILELSYKDLPDNLKSCFLYFGIFPSDKDVCVTKLTRLWIAEGFVKKTGPKSLEDIAEEYLRDLIGRNLVLVAKRKSDGRVKVCRMHDLLRDLCMLKGKEQKFLQLITSNDKPYSSFDESVYGDDFDYLVPSTLVTYEGHRISVCVKRKHFVLSRPSGPNVRSLLVSAIPDMYPRCPYDVSFISVNLKLLKVLDVECINMGYSFANGIESLVHLRYLAVAGDIDSIPSSIANLWNLETLIVKGLKGKVVLPDTIWCMEKLRHVHVNNQAILTLQDDEIENFLGNITSLSSPSLSYGEVTEKIVRRLPNLRKLKCIFLESQHSSTKSNQFPRLKLLNQLESLNVVFYGRALNTGEFDFPLSLKKLTLSNFRLPWAHISPIGSLPNLEVLKLVSKAFEGTMWDMSEGEFLALKFLQLDTLSIVQWNASSDHLPKLQHLVLRDCDKLEEVPIGFVDIPTLQIIEVRQCRHSVEKSVRRIQEQQLELGIEMLKILIN